MSRFQTYSELFEEQVARMPKNVALQLGDIQISYEDLNLKSNQLAHTLRERGVVAETSVGIVLDRSLEIMLAILGVLKAGGAFVPIDAGWPEERVNFIVHDSHLKYILTKRTLKTAFTGGENTLYLEDAGLYHHESQNLQNINQPQDLAYIIYTSGTTGTPKGVMIEHEGLSHRLLWRKQTMGLRPQDVTLQFLSFAFDAYILSAFAPLISGAKCVLLDEAASKSPIAIKNAIQTEKVSHFIAVPALYASILDCSSADDLKSLTRITLAADKLSPDIVRRSKEKNARLIIHNEYGPTECSVVSTIHPDVQVDEPITIGKPIPGTFILVLNDKHEILEDGQVGEACIGGVGLARGYQNNPQLTAEKFISYPPYGRLYKTGDLVRILPDANIEFIGRKDYQIKIGGYRVELEEIENKLYQHPQIKDAVVIVQDRVEGDKKLSICYIPKPGEKIDKKDLMAFLAKFLPMPMIPRNYIALAKFPLSSNGKIDRKALETLDKQQKEVREAEETPVRWRKEELDMIRVLEEVLGVRNIRPEHHLVDDLGADSLALIRISAKLYALGYSISIQDFYRRESIQRLFAHTLKQSGENFSHVYTQTPLMTGLREREHNTLEVENTKKPKNVFLTGATGFLGVHLIKELIQDADVQLYCLVRGKDKEQANQRLHQILQKYLSPSEYKRTATRIHTIPGDITKEDFGLSEATYNALAKVCDWIIHSAAIVKHFGSYEQFESINVNGTSNCVKFAKKYNKKLYYISTTSVSGNGFCKPIQNRGITMTEKDIYVGQNYMENPYVRSKLEAESIVAKEMEMGLRASIFRVGNLTARSSDGVFQLNINENMFTNLLKSILSLRTLSEDMLHWNLEFTPVDFASSAIIGIAKLAFSERRIFHIFNHQCLSMLQLVEMVKSFGIYFNIQKCTFEDFCASFHRANGKISAEEMYMLHYAPLIQHMEDMPICSRFTRNVLEKIGFRWPEPDREYLTKMFKDWSRKGYIAKELFFENKIG